MIASCNTWRNKVCRQHLLQGHVRRFKQRHHHPLACLLPLASDQAMLMSTRGWSWQNGSESAPP